MNDYPSSFSFSLLFCCLWKVPDFFKFSSLFRIGWPTFSTFDQKFLENISCLKPPNPFLPLQGRIVGVPFSHRSDQQKNSSCTHFLAWLLAAGTRLNFTTVSEPPEGSEAKKIKMAKVMFQPWNKLPSWYTQLWELLRVAWGRSLAVL